MDWRTFPVVLVGVDVVTGTGIELVLLTCLPLDLLFVDSFGVKYTEVSCSIAWGDFEGLSGPRLELVVGVVWDVFTSSQFPQSSCIVLLSSRDVSGDL